MKMPVQDKERDLLSFLFCCPHGGYGAELLNNFRQNFENVIDIFVCVQFTQRKAQRTVGNLPFQTDSEQNMRRVKRTGGACGTGGSADAVFVQLEEERFSINPFYGKINVSGKPFFPVAVELSVGKP